MDFLSELGLWDGRVVQWTNHFVGQWPTFDLFVAWLLKAHIARFVPLILAMCWLWFERHPRQPERREMLVETLVISLVALFIARALALALPFRERPIAQVDLGLTLPSAVESGLRTWSSFPSDHAVLAFVIAVSLWRISRPICAWALLHAVIFICLPRLYVGFHYATDLIAGALLGTALALLMPLLKMRRVVTTFLLDVEGKRPATLYSVGFFVLFELAEMFDSVRVVAAQVFKVLRHMF
jgi:undecaprenyl-diphosphatase